VGAVAGCAGKAAGEPVLGVFWKKPKRVFCPPEDADFFNAGVFAAGVETGLFAMVKTKEAERVLQQGEHLQQTQNYSKY
jgi:hypothetical protein